MKDLFLHDKESALLLEDENFLEQCVQYFSALPKAGSLPESFVDCINSEPIEFSYSSLPRDHKPKLLKTDAAALQEKYGFTLPIQATVSTAGNRLRGDKLNCHVLDEKIPRKSFINVDDNLFVMRPELVLLHLAATLSVEELAIQCSKFFSIFTNSKSDPTGIKFRQALSSYENCIAFLDQCGNARGVKKLRSALSLAIYPTASNQEIKIGALYAWPWKLGSYSLGKAEFNFKVSTSSYYADNKEHVRYLDCYFPELKVNIEYDGREPHERRAAMAEDALRHNELSDIGIREFIVTKEQMRDRAYLDSIARAAARAGGTELPRLGPSFRRSQENLFKVLRKF